MRCIALRSVALSEFSNSFVPLGDMKALKPITPALAMSCKSSTLPGTTPPQSPKSTQDFLPIARSLHWSASILTGPASLAGLPLLTLPVWLDPLRSVGLQCIFNNVDARVPLALLDRCERN